mmetsp:Transcript_96993/g.278713  ORF Transcript_96993/g.278713 Transcript_96993/m.278713 type:complete len:394 (+) Transcript_96993:78-1259(+)
MAAVSIRQVPPSVPEEGRYSRPMSTGDMSRSTDFGMGDKSMSAPLMRAGASPQPTTWYTSKGQVPPKSCWRALGSTWRDWDRDSHELSTSSVQHCRGSVDALKDYAEGCLPHWGKEGSVRVRGVLEHELTWSYYRMRRHEKHPQRLAVGEKLPQEALAEKMRFGLGSQFQFWRDLRPPFTVQQVRRVDTGKASFVDLSSTSHPDGELYFIHYDCAIEYAAERLMDVMSDAGTFNNRIHGVAEVRIPNSFPQKRPLHILSWGKPTLIPPDSVDEAKTLPPEQNMPIATLLGVSPTCDRMQNCLKAYREAKHRTDARKKQVKVPELQRLLLGPHASLPRLAKMEEAQALEQSSSSLRDRPGSSPALGASDLGESTKKNRQHRMCTSAVGFVSYNG